MSWTDFATHKLAAASDVGLHTEWVHTYGASDRVKGFHWSDVVAASDGKRTVSRPPGTEERIDSNLLLEPAFIVVSGLGPNALQLYYDTTNPCRYSRRPVRT